MPTNNIIAQPKTKNHQLRQKSHCDTASLGGVHLYLTPCPELVEGMGFTQGSCLAVVGTTTPQFLPRLTPALSVIEG